MRLSKKVVKKVRSVKYDLLTVSADAKTVKGQDKGYLTGILYGSPGCEGDGKTNLCAGASAACLAACLHNEGRARVFKAIKEARQRRTLEYLADFDLFCDRLDRDIQRLIRHAEAEGLIPCVRLNGTFDQPKLALALAARHPGVQFYDYTKLRRAWTRVRSNYHLTFSYSGENFSECMEALRHGVNVAVVFQRELPEFWHGRPVINGDESDLRFLDETQVVVGLKAKGQSKKLACDGGFIQLQPAA